MKRVKNYGGALLLGGMLALAGCAGSDGSQGPQGPAGADGTTGPSGINGVAGKLKLTINGVVTAPVNGTNTATLTFTVSPAANVCPGGTCDDTLSLLGQKTLYAQEYNSATKTFDTKKNFSFGSIHFKGFTADGNGAVYTAIKASPPFTVETSASAYVYGYLADTLAIPATGNYRQYNAVSSAAKVYGTIGYVSTANVSGCEKCHGAPYSKHGYRQATVAGLPDFVSCKVCHTDQRVGSDWSWYAIADDPAQLAADPTGAASVTVNGVLAPYKARYGYTAKIMNDVHNSHAFEFNYPQSMANCVTCHKGKLANILTDANFTPMVCKSCHPAQALAGIESERAPAMHDLWAATNLAAHTNANLDPYYTVTLDNACNVCHFAGNLQGAKTFGELHKGYNEQIYSDGNGTRYDAAYVTSITSVSYDSPSYVGTVNFTLSGVSASTVVKWYPYVGLYGWDTKDFVVRVSPTASTAITSSSPGSYQLTFNLSAQSATIAADNVKRAEVVLLPEIGIDPTTAVSNTGANLAVASGGLTRTIDLTATSANALVSDASSYGKKIVDPTKCNACHDALATTFHNPTETYRGRAGVVACRVCHIVTTGASNFEMQSRSIDSFVHAAHAMQVVAAKNVDLTDPVQAMRYNDHVEGVFPNFAGPLNCEACHYPGTYDVPDQKKSLPSVLSALANVKGRTGLPYVTAGVLTGPGSSAVTGPAARACGACHRAFAINEGDGSKLAAFVGHVTDFGSMVDPAWFTTTSMYVEWAVGATTTSAVTTAPAGAQVERCEICHATAGSDHQALFNTWRNGTKQ